VHCVMCVLTCVCARCLAVLCCVCRGWQSGGSCAFRNIPPLSGVSPAPMVEWESAPTCMFAPTQQNSVPDTKGRLWGWQNSQSCAFRG
jgi:hypothetical protein